MELNIDNKNNSKILRSSSEYDTDEEEVDVQIDADDSRHSNLINLSNPDSNCTDIVKKTPKKLLRTPKCARLLLIKLLI